MSTASNIKRHPLDDDNSPGYIPTVEVITLARSRFQPETIKLYVDRERRSYGLDEPATREHEDSHLWEAIAVEFGCRELLSTDWSTAETCLGGRI